MHTGRGTYSQHEHHHSSTTPRTAPRLQTHKKRLLFPREAVGTDDPIRVAITPLLPGCPGARSTGRNGTFILRAVATRSFDADSRLLTLTMPSWNRALASFLDMPGTCDITKQGKERKGQDVTHVDRCCAGASFTPSKSFTSCQKNVDVSFVGETHGRVPGAGSNCKSQNFLF